jgi:hypothetical protein
MKTLRLVLLMFITIVLSSSIAFSGDYLTKEEKKQLLKDVVFTGYSHGAKVRSKNDCEATKELIRLKSIAEGKKWSEGKDDLNELFYNACVVGYEDRVNDTDSLPLLLDMINMIVDYY